MTLDELFAHRERFIGCIAIGRVPRRRSGERVGIGAHQTVLTDADAAAFEYIADTLLHRTGDVFSVTAQGYDYPSLARCPALEDDGRCAVHLDRKPLTCEVVPLDPLAPDHLQHVVLAARRQSAGYLGADCIHEGAHDGAALLTEHGRLIDATARDALTRRRAALAAERELWGRAVFDALREELFDSPAAVARIPAGGYMTISLVPALLTVARLSANWREDCVDYIDRQLALIDRSIERALLRRRLDERPVTQTLRGFANAYRHAREVLAGVERDRIAPAR